MCDLSGDGVDGAGCGGGLGGEGGCCFGDCGHGWVNV